MSNNSTVLYKAYSASVQKKYLSNVWLPDILLYMVTVNIALHAQNALTDPPQPSFHTCI